MNPLIKRVLQSAIFKNLTVLVTGTVVAQLIAIGFQIILRRVFSPADFGAFAVYMSLVGILATVSSLRYEQTIILPASKKDGINLLYLSVIISVISSLLFLLLIILFKNQIALSLNISASFAHWLYLVPITILLFSINQASNFYIVRAKQFKFSASNRVIRRLFEGLSQLTIGKLGYALGLVVGDFLGQIVVFIRTVFCIKTDLDIKPNVNELIKIGQRYKDFPIKNGIPSLLNAMSLLLPVIFINRQFNETVTGYFDLARMVLILPLSLVTASLSQVLLQRFAEKRNLNQSIKKEALSTLIPLLIVAFLFALVIQFFGHTLFKFIFGNAWGISGTYASILVWAFAFKFIVSPFNIIFTAFEKIGILSVWQSIYFLLILLLNYIPFNSIEQFLYAYLAIELVSYGIAAILNTSVIIAYEKSLHNQ